MPNGRTTHGLLEENNRTFLGIVSDGIAEAVTLLTTLSLDGILKRISDNNLYLDACLAGSGELTSRLDALLRSASQERPGKMHKRFISNRIEKLYV